MGTWGTAIFSDDLATDIKSDFRDKIAFGKSASDATKELVEEYQDSLADREESCVFWIALAATQWKLGRLEKEVRKQALEIINNKRDLERWREDSKDLKKREVVLEKLKEQLLSEQPKPKKLPIPFIRQTKMEPGDLIVYKHRTEKYIIFRVLQISQDSCGDRYPRVEILDYYSGNKPDKNIIDNLDRKTEELKPVDKEVPIGLQPSGTYYLSSYGKRDGEPWEKLSYLKKATKFNNQHIGTTPLIWWRDFDDFIDKVFEK